MPKIPQLNQNVRMQPNSPVSIADSRNARIGGEALADLGQGMANFGQSLNRFSQKAEETRKRTQIDLAEGELRREAILGFTEAQKGRPDGGDWVNRYDEYLNERVSQITEKYDDDLSDTIKAKALQYQNEHLLKLKTAADAQAFKFQQLAQKQHINTSLTNIRHDPENFATEVDTTLSAIENSAATPSEKMLLANNFMESAVVENVEGLVDSNRFDDAKSFLDAQGHNLPQESRTKYYDSIEKARSDRIKERAAALDRHDKAEERREKQEAKALKSRVISGAISARTAEERAANLELAKAAAATNAITFAQFKAIEKRHSGDDLELDRTYYAELRGRIDRARTPEAIEELRQEVHRAYGQDNKLPTAKYDKILGLLDGEEKKMESEPGRKAVITAQQNRIKTYLKSALVDFELEDAAGSREILQIEALAEFAERVNVEGEDPEAVADEILMRNVPKLRELPLLNGFDPILQETEAGIKQIAEQILVMEKRKKIDAEEASRRLELLTARRAAIKFRDEMEESAKRRKTSGL